MQANENEAQLLSRELIEFKYGIIALIGYRRMTNQSNYQTTISVIT